MAPLALVAAAFAAVAAGSPLSKRISYTTTCNAATDPTWSDCQGAFDDINSQTGNDPNYFWNAPSPPSNELTWTNGNCVVGIGFNNQIGFTNNYVVDGINALQSQCQVSGAGGSAQYSDPSFTMSVSVNSVGTPPSKRDELKVRDGSWTTAYTVDNAAPQQYWQQVLNALPGGSSWSLTSSQTQSTTVEASFSITEDLFEIFSSTQSVSYTWGQSYTTSTTESIPNNCASDQEGYLYFTPLFTQYHGGYNDGSGPSPADIYIPISESDGSAAGNYIVQCSDN